MNDPENSRGQRWVEKAVLKVLSISDKSLGLEGSISKVGITPPHILGKPHSLVAGNHTHHVNMLLLFITWSMLYYSTSVPGKSKQNQMWLSNINTPFWDFLFTSLSIFFLKQNRDKNGRDLLKHCQTKTSQNCIKLGNHHKLLYWKYTSNILLLWQ